MSTFWQCKTNKSEAEMGKPLELEGSLLGLEQNYFDVVVRRRKQHLALEIDETVLSRSLQGSNLC